MDFSVTEFDCANEIHLEAMSRWETDKPLMDLVTPVFDKKCTPTLLTREEVRAKYQDPEFVKGVFVISDGEHPVGHLSLQIDPSHLFKKVDQTSWLGLVIGERDYWGTSAARVAMSFFERKSAELGLVRIELGVFEFNRRAQKFYRKLGYQEIGRIENFTYYEGKFWNDIRMEKWLAD